MIGENKVAFAEWSILQNTRTMVIETTALWAALSDKGIISESEVNEYRKIAEESLKDGLKSIDDSLAKVQANMSPDLLRTLGEAINEVN